MLATSNHLYLICTEMTSKTTHTTIYPGTTVRLPMESLMHSLLVAAKLAFHQSSGTFLICQKHWTVASPWRQTILSTASDPRTWSSWDFSGDSRPDPLLLPAALLSAPSSYVKGAQETLTVKIEAIKALGTMLPCPSAVSKSSIPFSSKPTISFIVVLLHYWYKPISLPFISFTNCSWALAFLTPSLYSLAMLLLYVLSSLPSPIHLFFALELSQEFPVQPSLIWLFIFLSARRPPGIWAALPDKGQTVLTSLTKKACIPLSLGSSHMSSPTTYQFLQQSHSSDLHKDLCLPLLVTWAAHICVQALEEGFLLAYFILTKGSLMPITLPTIKAPTSILLTYLQAITTAHTHPPYISSPFPRLANPLTKMLLP